MFKNPRLILPGFLGLLTEVARIDAGLRVTLESRFRGWGIAFWVNVAESTAV